ncbi:hypothetical protein ZWY2020_026345 [Hordeum vulgare]|nr:hypothetical protein ZWY2020_026345 [Hordeum vulgare]
MASKITSAMVMYVLILALLAYSDARRCTQHPAKVPNCIGGIDKNCVKCCNGEGYRYGVCAPTCKCSHCGPGSYLDENAKIQ